MQMDLKFSHLISAALFVGLVAACGNDDSADGSRATLPASLPDVSVPAVSDPPTGELAGDEVVFIWSETGGCAMGGPNCARYEVRVDGATETFREGSDEVAASGSVDSTLVVAWLDALLSEDIDALRDRVGEGELTAAFDGVDFTVADPISGIELSSVATAFDQSEPVFAAAFDLAAAAAAAAPLEIETR